MKLSIPKENRDIQKAVNRRMLRQLIVCILWSAAVSAVMIAYAYDYFVKSLSVGNTIAIWVILCMIPFVKCKCWQWFDRAYEGEVISCRQTGSVKKKNMDNSFSPSGAGLIQIYTQNIRLRLTNNREKTVKLTWLSDDDVPFYYEGDYVRHYRGTKFMQVISDKPEVPRICVMCGTQHLPDETYCDLCKLSLIDHRK